MTYLGRIGELSEVGRTRKGELSVEWRIRDVLSLAAGSDDWYQSPDFGSGRWALRLFPNRADRRMRRSTIGRRNNLRSASKALKVRLVRWDEDHEADEIYDLRLSFIGAPGWRNDTKAVWKYPSSYWVYQFPRSWVMEHRDLLMPGGVLTVTCDIKKAKSACCASVRNDSETGERV